jgi:molybdopterin synthase catalytic subunit
VAAAAPAAATPAAAAATGAAAAPVRIVLMQVTDSPLSVEKHARLVDDAAAGAVVTFGGVVRDHDEGRSVRTLFYEGHPSAGDVLTGVVAELTAKWTGVRAVAVSHRLGALEIGDVALACAVAAEHRAEGFAACAELVDEVKSRLPVWKHQRFADGTDEWVNSP